MQTQHASPGLSCPSQPTQPPNSVIYYRALFRHSVSRILWEGLRIRITSMVTKISSNESLGGASRPRTDPRARPCWRDCCSPHLLLPKCRVHSSRILRQQRVHRAGYEGYAAISATLRQTTEEHTRDQPKV